MYTVGIVGTGDPDGEGFAMAYAHAAGYERRDDCEIVACADLVRERAEQFADEHAVEAVYEDYEVMLEEARPDVVSVCVPPSAHADVVVGCARSGAPSAIHCEKPMADRWDDARRMARECARADIQLTFNHQRRFGRPYREAKRLLDRGDIGELRRVEFAASNLYDYGTHSFDLSNYFTGQATPEWVLAGLDYREENLWFGAHNENQGLACWAYENGVHGLATTGDPGQEAVGAHNRLVGTEGTIELGGAGESVLRVRRDEGWETIDTGEEDLHGPNYVARAIDDVIKSLDRGEPSELRAENALDATKLVFGAYESVRRRGRVEFPLTIDDNPLAAMVEDGTLPAGR